jgi:hypothetical protein
MHRNRSHDTTTQNMMVSSRASSGSPARIKTVHRFELLT